MVKFVAKQQSARRAKKQNKFKLQQRNMDHCLQVLREIQIQEAVTEFWLSLALCGFERATEDVWLLLYTEQPNDDDDCTYFW